MIITIDGPVASGKSTIAQMIAKKLSFYYISSGTLYRALAYVFLIECGLKENDLINISYQTVKAFFDNQKISYSYNPLTGITLLFNKINITNYLQDKRIEQGASIIGKNEVIRDAINEYLKSLADDHNIVIEGRDIGTGIFTNADFKFYLTASILERTQRWHDDIKRHNQSLSFAESLNLVQQRDKRDEKRLKPAPDAIIIDNTGLSQEQTLSLILSKLHKR